MVNVKIIPWAFILFLMIQTIAYSQDTANNVLYLRTNKLANVFHAIDQASDSLHDFFQIQEYGKELKPLLTEHNEIISSYNMIRKKYIKVPDDFSGDIKINSILFAPSINDFYDPIADAFLTSAELDDALDKLKSTLTEAELMDFKKYFLILAASIENKIYKDSVNLDDIAKILNDLINQDAISQHFNLIRNFYVSGKRKFKSVLILWTPASSNFSGNCYGDHLLIRVPNSDKLDLTTLKVMVSVIVHEATHNISANTDKLQKAKLSSIFLQNIELPKEGHSLMLFEEPLVLATQMYFIKNTYPGIYNEASKWFINPMSSNLLNLLNEYIVQNRRIDETFMIQAAKFYSQTIAESAADKDA